MEQYLQRYLQDWIQFKGIKKWSIYCLMPNKSHQHYVDVKRSPAKYFFIKSVKFAFQIWVGLQTFECYFKISYKQWYFAKMINNALLHIKICENWDIPGKQNQCPGSESLMQLTLLGAHVHGSNYREVFQLQEALRK